MIKIFPSLLEESPEAIFDFVDNTQSLFERYQIDIVDGILFEGSTANLESMVAYLRSNHKTYLSSFELHFMVQDIARALEQSHDLTDLIYIDTILVHTEAVNSWMQTQSNPADSAYTTLASAFPIYNFGIVIGADTNVEEHIDTIRDFPIVQIMTVQPGGQGRPFQIEALDQIKKLRDAGFFGEIQLDGGINLESMALILQQPDLPDSVCPGSFLKENTQEHYEALTALTTQDGTRPDFRNGGMDDLFTDPLLDDDAIEFSLDD